MRKINCKMKKLIAYLFIFCMAFSVSMVTVSANKNALLANTIGIVAVKSATKDKINGLPSKLYEKIKGWWTDNSSGGYDRKVTKKYIKVYDRTTKKLVYKSKIYGWKNTSQGYLIKLKYPHNNAKYSYLYNEQYDLLDYYGSWDADGQYYSGSASMDRIE